MNANILPLDDSDGWVAKSSIKCMSSGCITGGEAFRAKKNAAPVTRPSRRRTRGLQTAGDDGVWRGARTGPVQFVACHVP